MDNCGGHGPELNFPNVTFKYLSPRSTAKNQPLDLGIIAHSKIRFRSILLRKSISIVLKLNENDENRPTSSRQGMLGINESFYLMSAMRWSFLTNHGLVILGLLSSSVGLRVNFFTQIKLKNSEV